MVNFQDKYAMFGIKLLRIFPGMLLYLLPSKIRIFLFTPIWMHGTFIIIFEQFTIFSNLITVLLNWGNSIIIWDIFNSLTTMSVAYHCKKDFIWSWSKKITELQCERLLTLSDSLTQ